MVAAQLELPTATDPPAGLLPSQPTRDQLPEWRPGAVPARVGWPGAGKLERKLKMSPGSRRPSSDHSKGRLAPAIDHQGLLAVAGQSQGWRRTEHGMSPAAAKWWTEGQVARLEG